MIMHHIVHCIDCVFLCCRYLSPLDRRDTEDVIVDTDEDSMLSSEVPGKQNPLAHSDTIPLSRPALFYCIKTTRFKLLCAVVVEPISSAWPVIATVTRWNPLACVGVDWSHWCVPTMLCLLLPRVVSGLIHWEWIGVLRYVLVLRVKCVNTIW